MAVPVQVKKGLYMFRKCISRMVSVFASVAAALMVLCVLSCAGTVGGDDSGDELANVGGSINNTSLSISLPSYRALSETDRWQRDQVASYTATIDSGTYSDTKTAEAGGSLLFSAIPVGHYVITAYAKTANGDIMANTDPDNPPTVDVVAGQTNSTTVQLNRLYYKTVSFRNDDGGPVAGIPEQRVTVGYTATKPEDPASPDADKFFSHWVKGGGDSSAYNFNDPVTENITLRPVFSDKCKVEFDLNYTGCTNPDPLYAMAGETVSPPSDPVRTGCTFAGWYTDTTFTTLFNFSAPLTGNKTAYAKWTVKVTFNKNCYGSAGTMAAQDVVYGVATTLSANTFSRGTATFKEWNTEADGTGTNYTDGANITVSDAFNITEDGVTLYAIWNVAEPVMDYGITINRVIRDYNDSGSGDMTFVCSPVPPADDLTPQNLNSSGGDVWCWLDGTTIKFYSEWLAADSTGTRKLKLHADSSMMFNECYRLTSIDLSKFDTSNVTNMEDMFNECPSLTSITFGSSFNTSKVTTMNNMFHECESLTSLDVSGFDTSAVTDMKSMFDYCTELRSLDVSSFDTSKVTDMTNMFFGCYYLGSITFGSSFNTSSVTSMEGMFEGCEELRSLDVSGFDTSNVTDMAYMFLSCTELRSLDVSGFDTSKVTNMTGMFRACSNLESIDVSDFDTSSVTTIEDIFRNCTTLTTLDVRSLNTSRSVNMRGMFWGCSNLTTIYVASGTDWRGKPSRYMFTDCTNLTGGNGTTYDPAHQSAEDYGIVDGGPSNPGYFTVAP